MKFQKKILVIEDDQFLGITIQKILTINKYDVCWADNGAAGIQKAFTYNPDLILCDIHMDPVDGYQVYKILEESSILNQIPFVFLTGNSELKDIRFGLSLGADDYLVKPFQNAELIQTIEKRLQKFDAIKENANREFTRLFDLSPNGILLFDAQRVYNMNPALKSLLQISSDSGTELTLEQILNRASFQAITNSLQLKQVDGTHLYNDLVELQATDGTLLKMKMAVSEFERFSNYTVYIGVISALEEPLTTIRGEAYADEVYKVLKRENIKISEVLGQEITNIFKTKHQTISCPENSFFTRRENQVLCLAMEGLPIKQIADRLEISDRTVEKYRTKLMEKTGSNNMIEVIVFALKNSLIEL